jgi:hypothetical protein
MLNNNWSFKVEYDYVRLETGGATGQFTGSNSALNPGCIVGAGPPVCRAAATATVAGHPFDNVVTVGINYHFH